MKKELLFETKSGHKFFLQEVSSKGEGLVKLIVRFNGENHDLASFPKDFDPDVFESALANAAEKFAIPDDEIWSLGCR